MDKFVTFMKKHFGDNPITGEKFLHEYKKLTAEDKLAFHKLALEAGYEVEAPILNSAE